MKRYIAVSLEFFVPQDNRHMSEMDMEERAEMVKMAAMNGLQVFGLEPACVLIEGQGILTCIGNEQCTCVICRTDPVPSLEQSSKREAVTAST